MRDTAALHGDRVWRIRYRHPPIYPLTLLERELVGTGERFLAALEGQSPQPALSFHRAWALNGGIDWVYVRNEEAAAFAAGADAQLTGEIAVCAGSCGPGNLHLINGLYDAHRSGAPVLAIASHIPSSQIGSEYFQETHPDRLFLGCSSYRELISSPAQAPRVVNSALRHAISLGGVAVISLPGDIAELDAVGEAPELVRPGTPALVPVDSTAPLASHHVPRAPGRPLRRCNRASAPRSAGWVGVDPIPLLEIHLPIHRSISLNTQEWSQAPPVVPQRMEPP